MKTFLAALALALAAAPAGAQPADVSPSFEVASIKRSQVLEGGRMMPQPGGRFELVNGTTQTLISFAYSLRFNDMTVGAPDWVRTERYDVNAKAPSPTPSPDQMRLMVRTMLRERFNLQVTQTQQVRPVYALVLARADGRLGPKLQKAAIDCDTFRSDTAPAQGPPPASAVAPCTTRGRSTSLQSGGTPMSTLATLLIGMVDRPVIDNTGLKGYYTYELEYEPTGLGDADREPSKLPSIFTALQEQLGLRLEATRAPVDVLVIDRIERPTPD